MKKNMIVAFAVMMMQVVAVTAQTPKQTIYKPEQVEQRAMFPGGQEGMLSYMMQNMKYPKEAEKDKAQGTVVVHFVVEADGSISDVHVPDSQKVHPILDAAAVQFVRNMPKWKPGSQRGKPVEVSFSLPIAFPPTNNFQTLETKPEYPGGAYALEKYISKQLAKRPKITKKKTGKYRFIINKQGFAENISVVRGINSAIDDMVVSALQNMSQWNCAYFRKDPNQWPVTISITADKYGRLSVSVDTMWVNR